MLRFATKYQKKKKKKKKKKTWIQKANFTLNVICNLNTNYSLFLKKANKQTNKQINK